MRLEQAQFSTQQREFSRESSLRKRSEDRGFQELLRSASAMTMSSDASSTGLGPTATDLAETVVLSGASLHSSPSYERIRKEYKGMS